MGRLGSAFGAFRPLAHRRFRALWCASTVALFGFWMHRISAGLLMASLSSSPALIGWMEALYFLPAVFVAAPAGILADFVNRPRYLLAVLTITFATQLVLVLIVGAGGVTPAWLLGLTFVLGLAAALRNPALDVELSRSVPPSEMKRAFALDGIGFNLARVVGPALAGVVLVGFGLVYPFVLSAASTVGLLWVFLTWRAAPAADAGRRPDRKDVLAGFRSILACPSYRAVLCRAALFYCCSNILWALLPLLARQQFHCSDAGYSALYTCFGVGAILGGLMYAYFGHRLSANVLVNGSVVLYAVMLLSLAFADNAVIAGASLALGGASLLVIGSCLNSTALALFCDGVKARAIALLYLAVNGSIAVGTPVWANLAQGFSLSAALVMVAAFAAASVLLTPWLSIRETAHPADDGSTQPRTDAAGRAAPFQAGPPRCGQADGVVRSR